MDQTPETPSIPEIERTVDHAYLFDIDGVITDPEKKQITEPRNLTEIIRRLETGEPVALVTGRSLDWVEERVLGQLEARISNRDFLENLFVSGEFGGSYIKYVKGKREHFIDPSLTVPQEVTRAVEDISKEFAETMMWDTTKKTMVSIEMKDGVTVADFKGPQLSLVKRLNLLLKHKDLGGKYQVHKDRIATNIMERRANKAFAAAQVLNWLKGRGINPQQFVAFGDSESDTGMPEEIYRQQRAVKLVFVGEEEQLKGRQFPFPVIFTDSHFEQGALEYLTSHT